ncbi:MAG: 3'(2'),5'-bisphosphate nucleotidase CysQ [Gemmataceae bacterium]|nr:3'(2'),5'-bisphosphate nucleotidase CysQ [Gemmataceae bacterium]MDW8264911.1 3'(2'),5'-bisphosphate nucleotidase CysQ [Gemmataceae bacterium]
MLFADELDAALEAAREAGALVLRQYAAFRAVPDAPPDIHTEADRQAQELLLQRLHHRFPDDAFCAEEATPTLARLPQAGPRRWIIDPIDGSRGFARKNDEFAVMIALVVEGQVQLGVVLEPARYRLTYAVRGGGCWRRDGAAPATRCYVSDVSELSSAVLVQSRSRDPGVPSGQVQALQPARVIEVFSAGLKLALVARGEADVYVNRYQAFHDWDVAAGHILVEEAGGTVTGLAGQVLHYGGDGARQRDGVLATNGRLHPAALGALARLLKQG